MSYAKNTTVSEHKTLAQIQKMLVLFGVDEFGHVSRQHEAIISCTYKGIRIEMSISLPARDDKQFTETPTGQPRCESAALKEWEKEVRRKWRALYLVIKGLLVGIADGVLDFNEAFLSWIVLVNGVTVYQKALPYIEEARIGQPLLEVFEDVTDGEMASEEGEK